MYVLGISAFYHDAAAALLRDGEVVAAAQEERFTRRKGDARFPRHAVRSCLAQAGIGVADLAAVAFHEKPWLRLERLLESYVATAPASLRAWLTALPSWMGDKLFVARAIRQALGDELAPDCATLYAEHHESHMAAAFYPSPFEEAAILTVDGVGEWATTTWGAGAGSDLTIGGELHFPHSLGLLYSAFTAYLGFRVNDGEYKVMGLAPYGEPRYARRILDELVDLRDDGSFRLALDHFGYVHGLRMTSERFHALFEGPPRLPESPLRQRDMDIARSLQVVTEEIVLRLARHAHRETGRRHLVMAGGVALNCVANGRLLREGPFDDLWIQPAAGDAGSALGAALVAWHRHYERPRPPADGRDRMGGAYLGPSWDEAAVGRFLDGVGAVYRRVPPDERAAEVARLVDEGQVVGLFQGRMEFGPRALGNRSILGDARSPTMQSTLNLKIKYRESFRPFAPAVLEDAREAVFALDRPSPYMLLVAPVQPARMRTLTPEEKALEGLARLKVPRSDVPAVTHVDGSARVQSVDGAHNPRFHAILRAFEERTGLGCVINTSFNVRDEPIVCSPEDAWNCFLNTEMDQLVLEDCVAAKRDQPAAVRARRRPPGPREEPPAPPTAKALRGFGLTMAAALALFGLLALWRAAWSPGALPVTLFGVAAAFAAAGVAAPRALALPYRGWMALGHVLGQVTSRVVLLALYLVVVVPIGLVGRALRKDPLGRRPAPPDASYWKPRPADARGTERYTHRF